MPGPSGRLIRHGMDSAARRRGTLVIIGLAEAGESGRRRVGVTLRYDPPDPDDPDGDQIVGHAAAVLVQAGADAGPSWATARLIEPSRCSPGSGRRAHHRDRGHPRHRQPVLVLPR
jgi:hypothetical protein